MEQLKRSRRFTMLSPENRQVRRRSQKWVVYIYATALVFFSSGSLFQRFRLLLWSVGTALLLVSLLTTGFLIITRKPNYHRREVRDIGKIAIDSGLALITDDVSLKDTPGSLKEPIPAGTYELSIVAHQYSDGFQIERLVVRNGQVSEELNLLEKQIVVDSGLLFIVDAELRTDQLLEATRDFLAQDFYKQGLRALIDVKKVARGVAVCPPNGDGTYRVLITREQEHVQIQCVLLESL